MVSTNIAEMVVTDRIIESIRSFAQLKVLAARNIGNAATQGDVLNIMKREIAMVLSENFAWL